MEVLNYSLWFTFIWWSINSIFFWKIKEIKLNELYFSSISIPAVAILLEYLIMR